MKISQAFPSKYLSSHDLNGMEATLTISNVAMEVMGQEQKPVVYFQEAGKGMVLNKTNANTIAQMYGDDTEGWLGKQIILFAMKVEMQGKLVDGLRCRSPHQTQPFVPQQPVQAAQGFQTPAQAMPNLAHPMAPGGIGNPVEEDEVPY